MKLKDIKIGQEYAFTTSNWKNSGVSGYGKVVAIANKWDGLVDELGINDFAPDPDAPKVRTIHTNYSQRPANDRDYFDRAVRDCAGRNLGRIVVVKITESINSTIKERYEDVDPNEVCRPSESVFTWGGYLFIPTKFVLRTHEQEAKRVNDEAAAKAEKEKTVAAMREAAISHNASTEAAFAILQAQGIDCSIVTAQYGGSFGSSIPRRKYVQVSGTEALRVARRVEKARPE